MLLCIIVLITVSYRDYYLPDYFLVEFIGNVITIIVIFYSIGHFLIASLEIDMLKEKREKAKRTLDDFHDPILIPLQSIIDYFDYSDTELVLYINNKIIDINSGSRSRRFKRERNVFNRVFYINDEGYYDEIGFELFKRDLIHLVNNDQVEVLFHKKQNFHDDCFKHFLEHRDEYEKDDYDGFKDDWRNAL